MAAHSTLRQSTVEEAVAAFIDKYASRVRTRLRKTTRTTRLLAALALVASIILSGETARRRWKRRRMEQEQGRRLVRTNSFLRNKDGSRTLYVPYRDGTSKVVIRPTKDLTFDAHRRLFLNPPAQAGMQAGSVPGAETKPGLNLAFLHQFLSLMHIAVPRWSSKETGLLLSHAAFLMLRTYLSLVVARLDGEIVRDLVAGNGRRFTWGIAKWCALGSFASYTNAMIKFLESKVSIAFRTRLTRYIHDMYLDDKLVYYKMLNMDGGVGESPDQFITQDLTLFCAAAASLYSSIGKPGVDFCVFLYQLYRSLGSLASTGFIVSYVSTLIVLSRSAPPFPMLYAGEAKKEGEFRALHARIIANAEEVAFYGGADTEKQLLNKQFKSLRKWMAGTYWLKVKYLFLQDFVIKYGWSACGYVLSSIPVFFPAWGGLGGAMEMADGFRESSRERGRMKEFITNKRLMITLAEAGTKLMMSVKEMGELAGYTSRVFTLLAALHRVHANRYHLAQNAVPELYSLADVRGTMQEDYEGVRFERAPIVAPNVWPRGGELLIPELNLQVQPGEHLLVTGPNGAGKTAIARTLAGLWPLYRGLASRPKPGGQEGIMFLPQRVYLSTGTLRDQVIYPDSEADMKLKGKTDEDLAKIMEAALISHLFRRGETWDGKKEWKDVLSGGEKQKMGFARVLYHEPRFVVLDEATSAIAARDEGPLYDTCKAKGITVITLSTRASLKKHHAFCLTLGMGDSGDEWELERIGAEREKMHEEKEILEIREQLAQVTELEKRKAEIEAELGQVWMQGGESLDPPEYVKESEDGDEDEGSQEFMDVQETSVESL